MHKLFISYHHSNEDCVTKFITHISSLTSGDKAQVEIWYDRNIVCGDEFWDNIEENLTGSDIICLFLSANYLASSSCKKEMNQALKMHENNGTVVIPIPLTACAWLDYPVSSLLAGTKDGKCISDFSNEDEGWYQVYNNIKTVLNNLELTDSPVSASVEIFSMPKFSDSFLEFLNNTEILSKTHGNKENLLLDDILVYPELTSLKYKVPEVHTNSLQVIKGFTKGDRIILVGEEQSGKTTLAKLFIKELYEKGFIPILVKDESPVLQGNLKTKIENAFNEQYDTECKLSSIDSSIIVPIIDDFYKAKRVEDYLEVLNAYSSSIIIVDDIFNLDYNLEALTGNYTKYKIRELKPSLRLKLISKWLSVSEGNHPNRYIANDFYAKLDEAKKRIDTQIDHGIMPSYPFFVLFLLSTYETMEKPMDTEITTQGYCYQSLIYFFLRKQGVKSSDIESYLNFLTEFAYAIFKNDGALSDDEFTNFIRQYKDRFNLTVSSKELIQKLLECNIIDISSSMYYQFAYPYLYYFFAGKYFAEHSDEGDEGNMIAIRDMQSIIENLHKNDYAYITVFIAHHTKSKKVIKRIEQIANAMFMNHPVASLSSEELSFFNVKMTFAPSLPAENNNPEKQREIQLCHEDEEEESLKNRRQEEEYSTELSKQLRGSIKTVEVIGQILRNRAGSMEKQDLKRLCEEAMDVHLRLMSSFFELVKIISQDRNNLKFLASRLCDSMSGLSEDEALNIAEIKFWNINLGVIIGLIIKITNSLSSANLLPVIKAVCDEKQTMASAIIKQNAVMWIRKSLHFDELKQILSQTDNPTAKRTMGCLLADYCMLHNIDDKDRNRLMSLGFKKQVLLPRN